MQVRARTTHPESLRRRNKKSNPWEHAYCALTIAASDVKCNADVFDGRGRGLCVSDMSTTVPAALCLAQTVTASQRQSSSSSIIVLEV